VRLGRPVPAYTVLRTTIGGARIGRNQYAIPNDDKKSDTLDFLACPLSAFLNIMRTAAAVGLPDAGVRLKSRERGGFLIKYLDSSLGWRLVIDRDPSTTWGIVKDVATSRYSARWSATLQR
jgi:hypothetical protein